MQELLVDFITSLDGYGAAEGWPGWWGLEGPEYLAWLGQQPERDHTILMGANTYRSSGASTSAKASAAARRGKGPAPARRRSEIFEEDLWRRLRIHDHSPISPRGGEGNTVRTRTRQVRLSGSIPVAGAVGLIRCRTMTH
jgi:dihydrofolate reductase